MRKGYSGVYVSEDASDRPAQFGARFCRQLQRGSRLALLPASLFLFTVAITLMKNSARALGPLVRDTFNIENVFDALGFGWFVSYITLSGSSAAAAGLTLFDEEVVSQVAAYAIIVGSRLGASFIVLLIGFLYILRGRNTSTSLSMGLLSLAVTGSIQIPAFGVGFLFLQSRLLDGLQPDIGQKIADPIELALYPVFEFLSNHLPIGSIFFVGLGVMLISFYLFDRCLPTSSLEKHGGDTVMKFVYKPWVIFLVGVLITLISMSVSISLAILVPLSQRGLVQQENIVPYILGANISTFTDTFFAAVLLKNGEALAVVVAAVLSMVLVSALVLGLGYRTYNQWVLNFIAWLQAERRNLVIFMAAILVVPVLLMIF